MRASPRTMRHASGPRGNGERLRLPCRRRALGLRATEPRPYDRRKQSQANGERDMSGRTLRSSLRRQGLQVRAFRRRVRNAGHRPHPEGRRLRVRAVRHRAFGLLDRRGQIVRALLRGGGSAGDLPRALQVLRPSRALLRHGRGGHHGAARQRCTRGGGAGLVRQILPGRQSRRRRRARARQLHGRAGAGEAESAQPAQLPVRADRDGGGRGECGRDRRREGRRLPVGRPLRSLLLARAFPASSAIPSSSPPSTA